MTTAPNRRAPLRRRLSPAACGPPAEPRAWAAHVPAATLVQIARFDSLPSLAACRPVLGPAMPSPGPCHLSPDPSAPAPPTLCQGCRASSRPPGGARGDPEPFPPPCGQRGGGASRGTEGHRGQSSAGAWGGEVAVASRALARASPFPGLHRCRPGGPL